MALVDDNIFPKLILAEGAAPSSPAAGDFKLYFDSSDHLLKWKNSAGTVKTIATADGAFANPMTTAGDMIYGGAAGVATRLAGGTSGYVVTSNGPTAAPSWQAAAGGGGGAKVWLTRAVASGSATLDLTGFISAMYLVYVFEFVNVIPATSGDNLLMRMGTGGGPTYDTGANYGSVSDEGRAGGSAIGGAEGGATSIALTRNGIVIPANFPGVNGDLKLYNPGGALYKPVRAKFWYPISGTFRVMDDQGGDYDSTTAVTAVRFFMSTGNIASGSIDVYGLTHA